MASAGEWAADEAFALVRRSYPYRDLSRRDFDDCLAYLHGLDPDGRPWLPPRLRGDAGAFSIRDERTARLLRRNLGTILAEERVAVLAPFSRDPEGSASPSWQEVGDVDEAFADRLQPGDRFLLDGRCLEFRRREGESVFVEEVAGRPATPRWGGDGWPLSTELARRLFLLRVQAAEALRDGPAALAELLRRDYGLEGEAADLLLDYFQRQECVSEIPDAASLLIEEVVCDQGADYYLHTPLNRKGNDALARVAVHRLARDRDYGAAAVVADLGFALRLPGATGRPAGAGAVSAGSRRFEADLDAALADGPALRQRFGRTALTGLMLLRNPLGHGRRVGGRDWGERRLFDQVRARDRGLRVAAPGGAGNPRRSVRPGRRRALRRGAGAAADPLPAAVAAVAVRRGLDAGRRRPGRTAGDAGGSAAAAARGACRAGRRPIDRRWHRIIRGLTPPARQKFDRVRGSLIPMLVHDEWLLTPQRVAVHLPTATAVLADLHLGYNEARRRDGEAVPPADLVFILAPLQSVITAHSVRQVVIAGDLFEAGVVTTLAAELIRWMNAAGVELAAVVPGNHDRGLVAGGHGLPIRPDGFKVGRWRVVHGDGRPPDGPVIQGHEHPFVRWSSRAAGPCYLVGEERIVLPAFSEDAAGANVINARKWSKYRCGVVAGDRVLDFGELAALRKRLGRDPKGPRPARRDGRNDRYQ